MPVLSRNMPKFSLEGEGELSEFPGDDPADGLSLLEDKLAELKKRLTNAAGSCRKLDSRSREYEAEGKLELAAKAIQNCEIKRQECENLKDEIAALEEQIRVQKKYA